MRKKKIFITPKEREVLEILKSKSKETVCGLRTRDILKIVEENCQIGHSTAYRALENFRMAGIISPLGETTAAGETESKILYAVTFPENITFVVGKRTHLKRKASRLGTLEIFRKIKKSFQKKNQELKNLQQEKRKLEKKILLTQKELTKIEKYLLAGSKL